MSARYRRDIDGLRAVAVLPVFGFHLGVRGMSGGFVGVDIFFVISGFLIGRIILEGLEEGTFSFADFYARRCRRILPALFAMLAVATIVGSGLLLPIRLVAYSHSLLAAALSSSNLYFLRVTNYFFHSDDQVLLHTWSLGVEEQYYLLFPFLALLIVRFARRQRMLVVLVCFSISLALSVQTLRNHPAATFFTLPTRAWELLAGVVVAVGNWRLLDRRPLRESCAALGLLALLGSIGWMSRDLRFPGLWALPPVLGAALVIAAGGRGPTVCGRLLSSRVLVFVGAISYSLYLWHWPVIVLGRQVFALNLNRPAMQLVVFAVSVGAAWLSWRFVERPFRVSTTAPRRTLVASAIAIAATAAVAIGLHLTHGLPGRFSPRVRALASFIDADLVSPAGKCGPPRSWTAHPGQVCLQSDPNRPNVLLVGDSFSFHLLSGLVGRYPEVNVEYASVAGCLPLIARAANENPTCGAAMADLYDQRLPGHPVDLVIIAARWGERNLADIGRTLDVLRELHQPVLLTGVVPEYELALPQLLAIAEVLGNPAVVTRNRVEDRAGFDRQMAALAAAHGAGYASLYSAMCHPDCVTTGADGLPLQSDYGHLTSAGSALVAEAFAPFLRPLSPRFEPRAP